MATVYTLNASACPVPVIPGSLLSVAGEVPSTFAALVAGDSGAGALVPPVNQNSVRADNIGRGGAGAYAVDWDSGPSSSVPGLNITTTGALNVTVGTGQALIDGPIQNAVAQVVSGITNGIARIYLWLGTDGVVRPVNNSLTPPASPTAAQVFIGSVVTGGGLVTEINGSGVCYFRGPHLFRRCADTGCPSDTPPSGLALFTYCPGGLFLWTGDAYINAGGAGRASLTFATDANKTLTAAEACNRFLDFPNSGVATLSVTRNVVLPLNDGQTWDVRNNSKGGQSLQFIGASGTGITVATGKVARVGSDGTNIIRWQADL